MINEALGPMHFFLISQLTNSHFLGLCVFHHYQRPSHNGARDADALEPRVFLFSFLFTLPTLALGV
jgi:hypothetical protein